MADKESILPENTTGIQTNTESSAEYDTEEEARKNFPLVMDKLFRVNEWHTLAGSSSADFQLRDKEGNEAERWVQAGDFISIDVPGPGSDTGEGHDWVEVEEINQQGDSVEMRVRPASNPRNERKDTAHFFSEEATSTFMVKREGRKITAGVYGRNEKPNTAAEKITDAIRNTAVALGAISGFAKIQWKGLVNGLVRKEEGSGGNDA